MVGGETEVDSRHLLLSAARGTALRELGEFARALTAFEAAQKQNRMTPNLLRSPTTA